MLWGLETFNSGVRVGVRVGVDVLCASTDGVAAPKKKLAGFAFGTWYGGI